MPQFDIPSIVFLRFTKKTRFIGKEKIFFHSFIFLNSLFADWYFGRLLSFRTCRVATSFPQECRREDRATYTGSKGKIRHLIDKCLYNQLHSDILSDCIRMNNTPYSEICFTKIDIFLLFSTTIFFFKASKY